MTSRTDRAFTLIELLVVISIISLLISILLPALKAARRQAQAVTCLSNIRQVGVAITSYAADHKGIFYYSAWVNPAGSVGLQHYTWANILAGRINNDVANVPEAPTGGYLSNGEITCPLYNVSTVKGTSSYGVWDARNEGTSYRKLGWTGRHDYYYGYGGTAQDNADWFDMWKLPEMSNFLILADATKRNPASSLGKPNYAFKINGNSYEGEVYYQHPGQACAGLMADIHAENMPVDRRQLLYNIVVKYTVLEGNKLTTY